MTVLVVEHTSDGNITGWRYEADDDYAPSSGELVVDDSAVDHNELEEKMVDTSTDPLSIVDDPNYTPPPTVESVDDRLDTLENDVPVARKRVSESDKQAFRDARSVDDLQGQLDVLFEVLTGETP